MMRAPLSYLSIRWKIILLAVMVLGLTSLMFIWQQYTLQVHQFELTQSRLRTQNRLMLEHLFHAQAERMQMLGNLLIEQQNVRENILHKNAVSLARSVEALAPELSFSQGVTSVMFHDARQNSLATWGDAVTSDRLAALLNLSVSREKPQYVLDCKLDCIYLTVVPISHQGHTIATVTLVSNLEHVLNDLHQLDGSDVAVLNGKRQDTNAPLSMMQIISASGGGVTREILKEAIKGTWKNDRFQVSRAGRVHQVILIPMMLTDGGQVHFALVSDVSNQIQRIDSETLHSLLRGLLLLGLAMLLLYLMFRPTLKRIHHVSQILPLLGQEMFTQVRKDYAARPVRKLLGKLLQDEVDELESLALALADRLEELKSESLQHAESLRDQSIKLKHERDFISGLLDTAPVLILSYGRDGLIRLANAYAVQHIGLNEALGMDFAQLFLGISKQEYSKRMSKMTAGVVRRMESSMIRHDGSVRDILWFHSQLVVEKAEAPTYLSVGMDITEHKKYEARIHNLAYYNPLTKLPNRRMLADRIRHAMSSSAQDSTHCAIIFIDLDHFKNLNDSKGQPIGDQLLAEIARRLRDSVREFDTVAHLGSDEFVVMLEELHEDLKLAAAQTRLIVEKLRSAISQPFLLNEFTCHMTSSAGVSLFSGHEVQADELLRQANIAMSHAKTSGRNTVRFFDPAMQIGLEARSSLEADLRRALSQNQFRLFYQAQVNADGTPLGAEVLLRWFHPERGIVTPQHFVALAEESVMILPIGHWVLETACAQIKLWEADALTRDLQLAVNVSARQFHQPDFVAQVLLILEQSGANPAKLKLELTESMVLDDIPEAVSKMEQLKKCGVRFSIDDFGTAYSSLSYLTQLPLDQLKIDQSFVRNIGIKPSDAIVVKTIINMANNLGMEVIAEGVETEAQRDFLELSGCHKYQGYLFSRPVVLEAFIAYLSTRQGADS